MTLRLHSASVPVVLALALSPAFSSVARAGDAVTIDGSATLVTGEVRSTGMTGIVGYPVIISNAGGWTDDATGLVTFTDEKGIFRVEGLAPGSYVAVPGTAPDEAIAFEVPVPPATAQDRKFWQLGRDVKDATANVEVPLETFVIPPGPVSN